MKTFTIPEDMSTAWMWNNVWYTMTMADDRKLDKLYTGGDKRGPTHAERLDLIAQHKWETCPRPDGALVYVRSPS